MDTQGDSRIFIIFIGSTATLITTMPVTISVTFVVTVTITIPIPVLFRLVSILFGESVTTCRLFAFVRFVTIHFFGRCTARFLIQTIVSIRPVC